MPVLHRITENQKTTEYFLPLCGMAGIVPPEILVLLYYRQLLLMGVFSRICDGRYDAVRFALTSSGILPECCCNTKTAG